ncbi:flavin-containing monooxygenase 5-like [Eucyclogobius newberryi]|uniref:flavin-containing monooxygenase 5-like n=1 Tax=Eucyclogobius newberryi TaxID=166745 RepID=UPI003B59E332
MVQRVAVIGAGLSGLSCVKTCLEEGLQPTCFESSHDIGGLWRYKEEPEPGRANIYQSVVINSSKEMMAFSDYPPPSELPNNMHHSEVLDYLRLYANHFKLLPHIQFKTTVQKVRPTPDSALTGQWAVDTEKQNGEKETHVFDAVIVCTGRFTEPHLPLKDFPGIENFGGRYFHSREYRHAEGLQGKRVVVIGIGNSGGDIAVDVSRVAEKVYLSTRSGAWITSRVGPRGIPSDIITISRMDQLYETVFPSRANKKTEKMLNQQFDHTLYGLQPKHNFFTQIPVVNDELPVRILSGRVQIKPNVKEFSGSSVVFDDGTIIHEVDVVIFATGYIFSFPFLPPELQNQSGDRSLYKHIIPPSLANPTLAVVGFINSLGAVNPVAEMQGRWATRVFKGIIKLPSEENMKRQIEKDKEIKPRSPCSQYNPLKVIFIPYMDSLAEQVGARPNLLRLLLTDPWLALQVFFGPCTSYQYRLTGPGRWSGARQAILSQWERVLRPFKTRVAPEPGRKPWSKIKFSVIVSGTVLMGVLLYKPQLWTDVSLV